MKEQYHFVVVFDAETQTFDIDYDTQDAKFNECPVYLPDSYEWEQLGTRLDNDKSLYNKSADALYWALNELKIGE